MKKRIQLDIMRQPDDVSCGATCLHAIYRYHGDKIELGDVVRDVEQLEEGGTLGVFLGCHALKRGYRVSLYSYNLQVFDPTWHSLPQDELAVRLAKQMAVKHQRKLKIASKAYLEFIELGGERNRSTMKEFSGALTEHRTGVQAFIADNGAPEVLFGDDAAPSPAEWLLHALVGCLTTTTAYHAAARGIQIEAIDSEIDGDLDLRGFLGVSEKTRKGYSAIRVSMRVKSKATPEAIRTLAMMSPVYDVVANSVPVSLTVETC